MIKRISIIVLMIVFLFSTSLVANAADKSLADQIYTKLAPYGLTQGDRVKMERYIVANDISNEEATAVLAKVDEAIAIMKASGITNIRELSSENLKKIKTLAQEAANIVGLSLIFKISGVEIYKDGKLVEAIDHTNEKLAYTGNSLNNIIISTSVAALALAVITVTKIKLNKVGEF